MARSSLAVHFIGCEIERTGLWCHDCALPSMTAFRMHTVNEIHGDFSGVGSLVMLHCPGCKERTNA